MLIDPTFQTQVTKFLAKNAKKAKKKSFVLSLANHTEDIFSLEYLFWDSMVTKGEAKEATCAYFRVSWAQ